MDTLLTIVWLFAPMGYANMAPVIANNIPWMQRYNQPLDFGRSFRNKRIFGTNKTIRGLLAGTLFGALVTLIQYFVAQVISVQSYSAGLNYDSLGIVWFGATIGFGAIMGDTIESFFKRQRGIEPGQNWVPFDQIDFFLGGLAVSTAFVRLPLSYYLLGICVALLLHPAVNIISWLLGFQKKPF